MKIRTAEFRDADAATFMRGLQFDDAVHIPRAFPVFRTHDHCRAPLCGEPEKRLSEPAMMEWVRGQTAELSEAIDENAVRLELADRLRDLMADRFALDFGRRKNVVCLNFRKHLCGRREIED